MGYILYSSFHPKTFYYEASFPEEILLWWKSYTRASPSYTCNPPHIFSYESIKWDMRYKKPSGKKKRWYFNHVLLLCKKWHDLLNLISFLLGSMFVSSFHRNCYMVFMLFLSCYFFFIAEVSDVAHRLLYVVWRVLWNNCFMQQWSDCNCMHYFGILKETPCRKVGVSLPKVSRQTTSISIKTNSPLVVSTEYVTLMRTFEHILSM